MGGRIGTQSNGKRVNWITMSRDAGGALSHDPLSAGQTVDPSTKALISPASVARAMQDGGWRIETPAFPAPRRRTYSAPAGETERPGPGERHMMEIKTVADLVAAGEAGRPAIRAPEQ